MMVVFTDLDGTLLDRESYSFHAALPALQRLRDLKVPVVFVSSKTLPEVELWRERVGNSSPFVIENGAAVFAPKGNPELPRQDRLMDDYEIAELGTPYKDLTLALKNAAWETGCRVRGFSDMTLQEVSRYADLPMEQAELAKARQYDEPFLLLRGDPRSLQRAVERRDLSIIQGGRFLHIKGRNDKGSAVLLIIEAYRRLGEIETVGLGDGPNDVSFLNLMDYPVLLDSPNIDEVRRLTPRARLARPGPVGWNESILEIVRTCEAPKFGAAGPSTQRGRR